jgi:hypothetical protein
MADRYWVLGTGTWDSTSTTNWSTSSGGAGGASVPTASDNVFFDANSNVLATAFTVTMANTPRVCNDFTASGLDGTMTLAGTNIGLTVSGSLTFQATNFTRTYTGTTTFNATTTGKTVTTNGVAFGAAVTFNGSGGGWTLGSALTSSGGVTTTQGTFDTSSSGNYAVTSSSFGSSSTNTRTVNLNASTITCSTGGATLGFTTITNLTFNAGTSQINLTSASAGINSAGITFYNVSYTSTNIGGASIAGVNTFNNLTITGRTSVGIGTFQLEANQTINGTLTLGAGTTAAFRIFLISDTIGTPRTLTVNALAAGATDIDFRDITVTGAAAPLTGTRFGDCKGNSGITFPAAKTVYYRQTGSSNWGTATSGSWSATSGGTLDNTQFPLAQDTAVFPAATYPASGSTTTINNNYNIGTIDMSLRTSNTMTLSTGTTTPQIYGNWINGTGITLSGTGRMTFAGRTTQTITSAAVTFTQPITIDAVSGSVTLQDAFATSGTSTTAILLTSGTFNANGYNVTLSSTGATGVSISGTITRTLAIGSGTWTIAGTTGWIATITSNLTVTGTGTISLTSASAKTFTGGSFSYSGITLNQGGAGDLTITGSNTFGNITNTVQPATVLFTAGTTSTFSNFSLSGTAGNLITIGSVTAASHTLSKASGTVSRDFLSISRSTATGGALWYAGANSTNGGNNIGWIFTAPPGGGYTISADNGTYAVTGQAATLLRSKVLSGDFGTYAVTGQSATLLRNKVLSGDYGLYTLTGQDAIITFSGEPVVVSEQLLIKLRSFTERRRF